MSDFLKALLTWFVNGNCNKVTSNEGKAPSSASSSSSSSFYPPNHFTKYVTKMINPMIFNKFIAEQIYFSSPPPAWNDVTQLYKQNPNILFVDVCLKDCQPSGSSFRGPPHNPGVGGWPTIRYFNNQTGIKGGSYIKVTEKPIDEELGGNCMLLMDYIEKYGQTILCNASDGQNCNTKELTFITKYKTANKDAIEKQLLKLEEDQQRILLLTHNNDDDDISNNNNFDGDHDTTTVKDDDDDDESQHQWILRQIRILKQLLKQQS